MCEIRNTIQYNTKTTRILYYSLSIVIKKSYYFVLVIPMIRKNVLKKVCLIRIFKKQKQNMNSS